MIYLLAALLVAQLATFALMFRQLASREALERADLLDRIAQAERSQRDVLAALHLSHRQEIAALNRARVEETANLLQRIQAPDAAVAQHAAGAAGPDPPPVNLESDDELFELYEQRVRSLASGDLSG